jgi:hypothetical protein
MFIGFGLLLLKRTRDSRQKERDAFAIISVAMGWAAYTAGLLLQYMCTFSEKEGAQLAAYWRYMGTYALGAFVIMIMRFGGNGIFPVMRKGRSLANIMIGAFMLCLLPYVNYYFDLLIKVDYREIAVSREHRDKYAYIEDALTVVGSGGSFLHLTSEATDISILQYNAMPAYVSNMKADEFEADNFLFTYVYLHNVDEQFVSRHRDIFEGEGHVANGLYRVEPRGDGVVFTMLLPE